MNKRKVDESVDECQWIKDKFPKTGNSFQSDEEYEDDDDEGDDGKNYEILAKDDIEGQEETGITHDGDIPITPFNMDEEMEEGHFDNEGMYHWNKEKAVKDNWLENIDWIKVKPQEESTSVKDNVSDSENEILFDEVPVYKQMLELMKEGETVTSALRRHGGSKSLSASERLKRKKAGLQISDEEKGNAEAVTKLTELADMLLSKTGNMDVYQLTYKQIHDLVKKKEKSKQSANINYTSDDLDMYADDFDTKEKARLDSATVSQSDANKNDENKTKEVNWEYKVGIDSDEIMGPHSTVQMIKLQQEGHFQERVWVRQCGSDGGFYSSDRIDFDLYI